MLPFVFLSDGVPAHVDALDGPERYEGVLDGVLSQLEANAADVHAAHQHQGLVTLQGFCLLHTHTKSIII